MKSKKSNSAATDLLQSPAIYRGRFAPSPTGPLHHGSLIAALASYLDARAHQGQWLVRIEDLDPPREVPQASSQILHTLERLGLYWDDEVVYQSQRLEAYSQALQTLQDAGYTFACHCSRQDLLEYQGVYPGTCREQHHPWQPGMAIRCRVGNTTETFTDRLQGLVSRDLPEDCGDFVIQRKDGFFAYQLAVVVDDAWQHITDVVRGIDLLDSTPRQLYLQDLLGFAHPRYAHIPVLVDAHNHKLSKQQQAAPLDAQQPEHLLWLGLRYLQQQPPGQLKGASVQELLAWAISHWQPEALSAMSSIKLFDDETPATV